MHGLPPGRGQKPDLTTAHDLAILGRKLIAHEKARDWASTAKAPFRNGEFIMYNPNKLIGTYPGLDGIKTGYHGPAGFCVTASAVRRGKRLISVVMGCPTDRARATETTRLLTHGFNLYTEVAIIPDDADPLPEPLRVVDGKESSVPVGYGGSLALSSIMNSFDSALLAALGLIPLCMSTGTTVAIKVTLLFRRLLIGNPSQA